MSRAYSPRHWQIPGADYIPDITERRDYDDYIDYGDDHVEDEYYEEVEDDYIDL